MDQELIYQKYQNKDREQDKDRLQLQKSVTDTTTDQHGKGVGLQLGRRPHDQVGDTLKYFPDVSFIFVLLQKQMEICQTGS